MKNKIFILLTFLITIDLFAFTGKVRNIQDRQIEITGENIGSLKQGSFLYAIENGEIIAGIQIIKIFHSKANGTLIKGKVEKGQTVSSNKPKEKIPETDPNASALNALIEIAGKQIKRIKMIILSFTYSDYSSSPQQIPSPHHPSKLGTDL